MWFRNGGKWLYQRELVSNSGISFRECGKHEVTYQWRRWELINRFFKGAAPTPAQRRAA